MANDSDSEKYHQQQQHTRKARSSSDNSCFAARVTESNLRKDSLVRTKPVLQLRASGYYNRDCLRVSSSPTSQDRFLTLTLTPYNLKSYKLCLPVPFVKANGIKSVRKITLVDRYGVRSTTSLKPEDEYGRMRLGKEWIKFCEDNGVKAGESFRLELIKEKDTANHLLKFCYTVIYSL
ncbi:unnamed protein product [Eruca vesicaria subsp. sativa]|uniref:TF-B3 domain-containing protein n=1 Tax=Eruca vesicaria subsp. sativa TaxID=29727 RepID=A0ABC8KPY5_ERUVS|nr:unnamed protein product [Eruca vesicaria subsp. sativa]